MSEEKDLDSILSEQFDAIQAGDKEPVEKTEETVEEPKEKPQRERDESGKFKKAEAKELEPVAAEEAPKELADVGSVEKEVVATVDPVSQAPEYVSAAVKANWAKLDPEVRADLIKQGKYADSLVSKHALERKKYEALDGVLSGQRQMLAAQYGDEVTGLKALFALSDFASKDPAGFVQYFAQQRGIDLRGLVQSSPAMMQADPNTLALQNRLQHLESTLQSQQQAQRQAEEFEAQRLINEFAADPANKYYEEVKADMSFLLESGKASDLKTAYSMACKLNDHVSELMLAEKQATAEAERKAKAQEAAEKAKKAAVINVKPKGITMDSPSGSSKSIDDTLEDAWNRIAEAG